MKLLQKYCPTIEKNILSIWGVVFFIIIYSSSVFADFKLILDPNICPKPCWEITGVINKSDLHQLSEFINKNKHEGLAYTTPFVRLNSYGGDIEVAMKIGRQLRRFRAYAFTWHQGKCYSACVFILAGATKRVISNNIGIHRPYSTSTKQLNYKELQVNQRKLEKKAKDYLREMNVSPMLYDAMVRIPPEKIKILSDSELEFYGLVEIDPVQEEISDNFTARKYGISKAEYLKRKYQVDIFCASEYQRGSSGVDNFESYYSCEDNVLRYGR